jgi:PhnB protein
MAALKSFDVESMKWKFRNVPLDTKGQIMTNKVKPIPDGYHAITPYLFIKGAAKALEFYQKVFGAKVRLKMDGPNGTVGHAEIQIGDSMIMLADECLEMDARSPQTIGGSAVGLHLYVEDVDRTFNQAVAAGAKVARPIEDKFYGDRSGSLTDPFGHLWFVSTHKEDLSPEEIGKRAAAMSQNKK